MKECKQCGVQKPLSEFYKRVECVDGHFTVCKQCVIARVRKRELGLIKTNPEWVGKEKARQRLKAVKINATNRKNAQLVKQFNLEKNRG